MRQSLLLSAVLCSLYMPSVSFAEDTAPAAATPDWTFPMTVGYVSDYIFRGQSQSWGKGSFQGSLEADHKSGAYAGLSIESVSDNWIPGASIETDFYAGFRNSITDTGIGYDVGAVYYAYPSANWDQSPFVGSNSSNSINTLEAYLAVSYKWVTLKTGRTLTEYFGWNTNNSAPASEPSNGGVGDFAGDQNAGVTGNTRGSYFYEANGAYEFLPSWTASGQIGRQVVADSRGLDLTYYKAGVTKAFSNGWAVGAFYSATNEPSAYKNFASLRDGFAKPNHTSDVAKDKVFVSIFKSF